MPIAGWMLALAGYLAVALAFQGFVFGARTSLPEPDDAYTYILKSAQIAEGCALQDCPALNSLRAELATKSADPDAEWSRYRLWGRVFLVYHPLYSGLLLALNKAGLSWEAAFAVLSCFGVILIGAGIGFFLLTLWGPAAASLALLLLAFSAFPGQGLVYIVPSNMALGLGFFALAFALRGWRWSMAATILLMVLMHPVGKIYGGVALLTAVLAHRDFRPGPERLLPYLAAAVLIGASFLIPLLIDQPVLRVDAEPMPPGFTMLDGLLANLRKAGKIVASGFGRGPEIGIPMALGLYALAWRGYSRAPGPVRHNALVAGLMLGGMCAALLVHMLPHYPAEAFQRGWVALAVLIAGAAAFAIVGPGGILGRAPGAEGRLWRNPSVLCLGFLAVFGLSGAVVLAQQALKIRNRHNQTFEPDQVRLLVERCGTAIHAAETAALFYLAHGANACPMLYLPAMKGKSGGRIHLVGFPRPLMLVAAKPGPQEIGIAYRKPAEISIGPSGALRLRLAFAPASSAQPALAIRVAGAGEEQVRDVTPGETDGIIAVDVAASDQRRTVTVAMPSRFATAYLIGIHAEDATRDSTSQESPDRESSHQDWPWNRDIKLASQKRVYSFSAADLTSGLFSSMEVIDSQGSTLLAKLNAPN